MYGIAVRILLLPYTLAVSDHISLPLNGRHLTFTTYPDVGVSTCVLTCVTGLRK